MAGKSNKGRNKKSSRKVTASESVSSDAPLKDNSSSEEPSKADGNGLIAATDLATPIPETKNAEVEKSTGELHFYAVPVRMPSGEKLELQLSPGDSVMDIRQLLLEAPETCYFTCYDLLLHMQDGSTQQLEDYSEISEVADITAGGCSVEIVAALYDDRSIRAHVHWTRELLSRSTLHSSLSTFFALQYDASHNKARSSSDPVKLEVPELDGLGFMEDVAGSMSNLLQYSSNKTKCVESIAFSSFNPPPSYRRLFGDLIYLDVVTLEGNRFCITGTTKMFYVNSSKGDILDPKPSKSSLEATTLVGLLQKISLKFKKAFREFLDKKASAHPFENAQCPFRPNQWLGLHPVPDHKRDSARAEDALTLTFGNELIGMQRDWNEELQSCREFPHTTPHERILRDRALYKVTSDFLEAATSGAIGVISKCIPPINPTDPECFHMYVHNNIFFSFAVDADIVEFSRKYASDSKPNTDSRISSKISPEKSSNIPSERETETDNEEMLKGSNSVEDNGVADVGDSESQLPESEQTTYASANNDLKGTKACQEADVPGLYNLAMAIIDYRGHRVVAQSILPGILQGDKSESLLYGSVDNGKKICWNEDFHSKVVEAAKRLHLKEHTVVDGSGNEFKLAAPVECKGIVGNDNRYYLLDLMRVTPRDANYTGPGSRFCILRPELITAFCRELREQEKSETSQECGTAPNESSGGCEENVFNPNVLTEFKLSGNPEDIKVDEEKVREVSSYLKDVVLPKFIQDLCALEVSPMDGQTLIEALHAHGINIRYIGKVANGTKHLPHLWDLCSNEIAVRSAKHIIKDILRDTEDHDLGPAVAHFFNCFFGDYQEAGPKGAGHCLQSKTTKKDHGGHQSSGKLTKGQSGCKNAATEQKNQPLYMNLSSDSLWSQIREFAEVKYQFEVPDDARARVKKISVLRNFCQKVGITVAARKYDLESPAPFQVLDILNLKPIVKHSIPPCSEAKNLVESGKVLLAEGKLNEAYILFSEAFSILQQVTGPMHREVANCCRYLAMVLYHVGDMAGAIMQQHKELIINERCLGLDHPDTAHSYGNMALFYHGLNQTEVALQHMSRALLLLSLSSGPDHPDVAATCINVAMMYQDIGKMNTALRYLQEALKRNERLLGEGHIQTAVCYHALAIACSCMGAFKLSQQHEKKTYDILVEQLGEEDSRTQDSLKWMQQFKEQEVKANSQKQKGEASNAASAQKALDILKAFHAAAAAGSSRTSGNSSNRSLNAALLGETLPRRRGIDERAARAAAEVRKKAAARGVLLRPQDVQIQTFSQQNFFTS